MKQFVIPGLFFLMVSCSFECNECLTPPENFSFKIVDDSLGYNLLNSNYYNEDSLQLYYYNNTERNDLVLEVHENYYGEKIILANLLGWIASENNHEFYLYLNHNDTDTICLEIARYNDECCTWYQTNLFVINTTYPEYDWDEHVYVIRKKIDSHSRF